MCRSAKLLGKSCSEQVAVGREDYEVSSISPVKRGKLLRKKNKMKIIRKKFTAVHLVSNTKMIKCTSKGWGTGAAL